MREAWYMEGEEKVCLNLNVFWQHMQDTPFVKKESV